jgi:hypothetical protein
VANHVRAGLAVAGVWQVPKASGTKEQRLALLSSSYLGPSLSMVARTWSSSVVVGAPYCGKVHWPTATTLHTTLRPVPKTECEPDDSQIIGA